MTGPDERDVRRAAKEAAAARDADEAATARRAEELRRELLDDNP